MSTLLHLGKSISCGSLGIECFQFSLDIWNELCVFLFCFSCPSSVQASGRTCHRSIQTSHSSYTLLNGGSLASHSPQHLKRDSWWCCIVKNFIKDVLVPWVLKGLSLVELTLLLLTDVCCTDKGCLPWSVRQLWGVMSICSKTLPAMQERMGRLVCLNSLLTTYSIPSESMYKVVIHVIQDLLRSKVISPITQEFHMISDLCLEYQQT